MSITMKIHNKWYDLTDFAHPGGPIMLNLGNGRDATAMFEAHHPFTNRAYLQSMLARYEMKKPGVLLSALEETQPYEWPEFESKDPTSAAHQGPPLSSFALELHSRARTYFEGEAKRRGVPVLQATKATPARWLQMGVLVALYLATLPAFLRGELWTLVANPLIYWILGVNVFHDASHFSLSRNWRINMIGTWTGFYFSAPLEWYHQHVIGLVWGFFPILSLYLKMSLDLHSHHSYPNIPNRDPDLYHNATMERHTATLRWRPMHAHQHHTWFPIWLIGTTAMSFLKPVQMYLSGSYNRAVPVIPMSSAQWLLHLVERLCVAFVCFGWPFLAFAELWRAVLFALVPICIVSVCFMTSSQVNHLSDANIDKFDSDFYKQQVITSHTFATDSWPVFMFTGGLNFQIEHHIFPTVNHCHLRALQPMVKEICQKHGVPYHSSPSLTAAVGGYIQHLRTMGRKAHDA